MIVKSLETSTKTQSYLIPNPLGECMKKTIKQLQVEVEKIYAEIRKRENAECAAIQLPYLRSIVGCCYVYRGNSYGGDMPKWDVVRKVISYIEKAGLFYLIFEEVSVDCYGTVVCEVNSHPAYLNKEWYKKEPFGGYEKCDESEYQSAKEHALEQMQTQSIMRKYLKNEK